VDERDIELYSDAEAAAASVEGYDTQINTYWGVDGAVYAATVEGPEWGPVHLHPTGENQLSELLALLRAVAHERSMSLTPGISDDPTKIWSEVVRAERQRARRWKLRSRSRRTTGPAGPEPGL
jgi:hypothetical protein